MQDTQVTQDPEPNPMKKVRSDSDVDNTHTPDDGTTDQIQLDIETAMDAAMSVHSKQKKVAPAPVPVPTETAPLKCPNTDDTPDTEDDEAPPTLKTQKTIRTHFSDAFVWIEPIIRYYPAVWITRDPNKTATATPNWYAVTLGIASTLLYCVLQLFYQITGWHLFPAIDNLVWCFYIVFVCTARILMVSYAAKYFNWPWSRDSLSFYYQEQTELGNKNRVAKYRKLYVFLSVAYIVLDLAVVIMETWALMPYYHYSLLTYILVKSLCRFALLYPLVVTTLIQSVIFVKYNLCLDQLWQEMKDPSTVDLQTIFEEYDKLYKSFRKDYHGTLRLSVASFLAAEVFFFWDSFNFMGMHAVMIVLLLREMTIFWLFFHAASNLEKVHTRLTNEVWKNGHFFLNRDKQNGCYYNYILQYIQKYSIYLTVGRVVVTTKNVMKFVCILMITRSFTYFGTAWAESKASEYTATTPAPLFNATLNN